MYQYFVVTPSGQWTHHESQNARGRPAPHLTHIGGRTLCKRNPEGWGYQTNLPISAHEVMHNWLDQLCKRCQRAFQQEQAS